MQAAQTDPIRAKALQLLDLVSDDKDPNVWTARRMEPHEVLTSLVVAAARFHQNQIEPHEVLGALLMAAAWVAANAPDDPSRVTDGAHRTRPPDR